METVKKIKAGWYIVMILVTGIIVQTAFHKIKVSSMESKINIEQQKSIETKSEMEYMKEKYQIEEIAKVEAMTIEIMEMKVLIDKKRKDKQDLMAMIEAKPDYILNPYKHYTASYDEELGIPVVEIIAKDGERKILE